METERGVPKDVLTALAGEAERLEGVCIRRALGHRHSCNFWNAMNYVLGLPSVVLAAVAGTSAFAASGHHHVLAGILALAAAVVAALATFLNPSQNARLHQHAAASYGALEGDFRRFASIDLVMPGGQAAALEAKLDDAVNRFNEVDAASPPIPGIFRRGWEKPHLPSRQPVNADRMEEERT